MDVAPLITKFVDGRFPKASLVVVGGSTARGERTATSDIDLLIIGPDAMFESGSDSLAAMYEFEEELFEVFAYTLEAFDRWAQPGVASFRPVIQTILVDGKVMRGEALARSLRDRWVPILDAGPKVDDAVLALRRYMITDMLDDLRDSSDSLERQFLASELFKGLAEVMLLSSGEWLGAGKWLVRRLRAWDDGRATALARPFLAGDIPGFLTAASTELDRVGGRVQAGFAR